MNKIKTGLVTFFSSICSLISMSLISTYLNKFYDFFNVTKSSTIDKMDGIILALLTAIYGALISWLLYPFLETVNKFLTRILIEIEFTNISDKKISKIFFEINEDGTVTQKKVKVKIKIKKIGILAFKIAKKMNFQITIEYNPQAFSTELNRGFLAGNNDSIMKMTSDGIISINFFDKVKPGIKSIGFGETLVIRPKSSEELEGRMLINVQSSVKGSFLLKKYVSIKANDVMLCVGEGGREL